MKGSYDYQLSFNTELGKIYYTV